MSISEIERVGIEEACQQVWDSMRQLGGAFWHELPDAMTELAMGCYRAGALTGKSRVGVTDEMVEDAYRAGNKEYARIYGTAPFGETSDNDRSIMRAALEAALSSGGVSDAGAVIQELQFALFSNDTNIKDRADQSARLFLSTIEPTQAPQSDAVAGRGEQRTICEACGNSNLAHDCAIWTDDGASFCPDCAPSPAELTDARLAEMVGAGVPCVPAQSGEIAAVVQELRKARDLMRKAHAVMRECGWQLAASAEPNGDGVLELACSEIEADFAEALKGASNEA